MGILRLFAGIVALLMLPLQSVAISSQAKPSGDNISSERVIVGQLLNVDTKARLISMRGPDQKETILNYNDDTQVTSPEKTIQGLTGELGSEIRTSYREERGVKLATRIELLKKR